MSDKSKKSNGKLTGWFILQTVIVMISSVMIYALIDYIANYVVYGNKHYEPVSAVGMFFPMGLVMGTISYFSMKVIYRFISKLTIGINHVANEDFDVKLSLDKAGPLKDVYIDFNKMVEELKSVQTLRRDFINNFSHEFRTPITSINGFAKLLLEESVTDEDKHKYLQIIADESERLASLANSSMLLSKLESQQFILDKEYYSLDEQIKRCAIILSPEWGKKEIEFTAELEPVQYYGNADLMQHVWINLIGNAIKFTPEYGEIIVTLKKENSFILVSVLDSGKGMSQEELAQIFIKYYQGDSFHSKNGLGLGLSIAKRIIDLCGGRIEVNSRINEGSTFTVYLPINIQNDKI